MDCVQVYGETCGIFRFFVFEGYVVLQVHILALKFVPCLFHSSTLLISQYTILLPGLWLLCIYIQVLIQV